MGGCFDLEQVTFGARFSSLSDVTEYNQLNIGMACTDDNQVFITPQATAFIDSDGTVRLGGALGIGGNVIMMGIQGTLEAYAVRLIDADNGASIQTAVGVSGALGSMIAAGVPLQLRAAIELVIPDDGNTFGVAGTIGLGFFGSVRELGWSHAWWRR
jgi:hypothetical protein